MAQNLNNLAFFLLAGAQPGAAEPLAREALSTADKILDRKNPKRSIYRRNLAAVLAVEGKGREAEPLAREALAFFRTSAQDPWRSADAESVLGSSLAAEGRFTEAEPLLVDSYYSVLKRDPGDGARYAPAARQRIIELYTAWGRLDRAAVYRRSPRAG